MMSIEAIRIHGMMVDNGSNHTSSASEVAAMKPQTNPSIETSVKEAVSEKKKDQSSEQVAAAVNVANDFLKMVDTGLEYEYNQKIDREVVKIYNRDTGEVIKQIPAEDMVNMLTKMYDMLGVLYDKKF